MFLFNTVFDIFKFKNVLMSLFLTIIRDLNERNIGRKKSVVKTVKWKSRLQNIYR